MTAISVIGAGAFGASLAQAQARAGREVLLWGRNAAIMAEANRTRRVPRLPQVELLEPVVPTADLARALSAEVLLLAIPAQALQGFLVSNAGELAHRTLVAACKGIDLKTLHGPWSAIRETLPEATAAVLTGPSFATEIGRGLPTALTLAAEPGTAPGLADTLATADLRLYRSDDPRGAELGGALKNVVAIAAGLATGAGFGESARAALITRGFAEMQRLALALGARPETLMGLSGLGDLILTATSPRSRNFAFGQQLAAGQRAPAEGTTVEGHATARALIPLAQAHGIDMPVARAVASVLEGALSAEDAAQLLLTRPLTRE